MCTTITFSKASNYTLEQLKKLIKETIAPRHLLRTGRTRDSQIAKDLISWVDSYNSKEPLLTSITNQARQLKSTSRTFSLCSFWCGYTTSQFNEIFNKLGAQDSKGNTITASHYSELNRAATNQVAPAAAPAAAIEMTTPKSAS
jgi:hypothetical protein